MKCPDCGSTQYEGTLFCNECGRFLLETRPQDTVILPFSEFSHNSPPPPLVGHKPAEANKEQEISFIIPGIRDRVTLNLVNEIRVGRADPDSEEAPDLDLTKYNGADKGVSRLHAVIQLTTHGIILIDLSSTNGTTLNNNRLPPDQPYLLQNGDEIRFGDMLLHVFFS